MRVRARVHVGLWCTPMQECARPLGLVPVQTGIEVATVPNVDVLLFRH